MGKIYYYGLASIVLFLYTSTFTNAQDDFAWAIAEGGSFSDIGNDIAADSLGNTYVTGLFTGSATFGTTQLTSTGGDNQDIFVAKYDPDGNLLWVQQAGSPNNDAGNGIAVDNFGNVFITGYYEGTATFGSAQISSTEFTFDDINYYPTIDIFIAKYSNSGTLLWVETAGGPGQDVGLAIDTDGAGNSFITGYFSETATFGTAPAITSNGGDDVFIAKYDPQGNVIWAVGDGGPSSEHGKAIATDLAGGSHVTGSFYETITFTGTAPITSTMYVAPDNSFSFSSEDIFVVKYDPFGTALWAQSAGGPYNDSGEDVDIDLLGNAYVTGYFGGEANFGSQNITGYPDDPDFPSSDIFIAAYNPLGIAMWAESAGGLGIDQGYGISVDNNGTSYITGLFWGEAAFGNDQLTSLQNSNNIYTEDIFLASYNNAGVAQWAERAGGTGDDRSFGVAALNYGIAFITGRFDEPNAVFPGVGSISSNGGEDIFVAMHGNVSPLPVHLISYTATRQNNDALLQWQTASEENNAGFVLEKSYNGYDFTRLASVSPKNGHTSYGARYSYTDTEASHTGTCYYRLWQHDLDGTETNLGVRAVHFTNPQISTLAIAPNPFSMHIKATIETATQQKALLTLTDGLGKTILSKITQLEKGPNNIVLPNLGNLQSGMYLLTIQLQTEVISQRIIKQ